MRTTESAIAQFNKIILSLLFFLLWYCTQFCSVSVLHLVLVIKLLLWVFCHFQMDFLQNTLCICLQKLNIFIGLEIHCLFPHGLVC